MSAFKGDHRSPGDSGYEYPDEPPIESPQRENDRLRAMLSNVIEDAEWCIGRTRSGQLISRLEAMVRNVKRGLNRIATRHEV